MLRRKVRSSGLELGIGDARRRRFATVQVDGQRRVARLRELLRDANRMLTEAPAIVDHHHARVRARVGHDPFRANPISA